MTHALGVRSVVGLICLPALLALGLGACGGGGANNVTPEGSVTIYSSLPLQGASRERSESIVRGEKLALLEAKGKVGGLTVRYAGFDDSAPGSGGWKPGIVAANARKAVQDQTTIAYLGEADSLASAISIPILNSAGILQISPASTYVGLTQSEDAAKGEPDKYYPSGERTFGRVIPTDELQAGAQADYQKDEGCKKLSILNDGAVEGSSLARSVARHAGDKGILVVGDDSIDVRAADFRSVATDIETAGADCVFFAGATPVAASRLWRDVHARRPAIKLFAADRLAGPAFTTRIRGAAQRVTFITYPALPPDRYPKAGQDFFRRYRARYGEAAGPYAIFGYEAMKVALQAIRDAGERADERQRVIDAFFKIRNRDSVLGKYSIDVNGNATLSDYGGYRVTRGRLAFDRILDTSG
jgi:branched-chain amino acid transport system substrate-binding protein